MFFLAVCDPLIPSDHVNVEMSNDLIPGAVAVYTCDDGYEMIGDHKRFCLATGTWGGSEPNCISKGKNAN